MSFDLRGLLSHRSLIVLSVALGLTCANITPAFAKTVSDPNHQGYTGKHPKLKKVTFKPVTTDCPQCQKITDQYNQTVQRLLDHRYWEHFWTAVNMNREANKGTPFWPAAKDAPITVGESELIAANLELFELQANMLALHRSAVVALENQASYLLSAIKDCEQNACKKKPKKRKDVKIGGELPATAFVPDAVAITKGHGINWQGPYVARCKPCLNQAQQLNALPGWVVRASMNLEQAQIHLKYQRLIKASNGVNVGAISYTHPDSHDVEAAEAAVTKYKKELAALKKLFLELEASLKACEAKFCPATGEEVSVCPTPSANEQIIIGPNSEVGTKADFKEKAKKKASGLATKAITGLLGIGGGGGRGSSEPTKYKDPVKNRDKIKVKNKEDKREIRLGGMFTTDGLLISTDLKKAPNKGTFHEMYLQNARGWRLVPIRLFLYEIWANWKLSVSWTRDTYVDGELVKHEEGAWSESWRELIARGRYVEYAEVFDAPIWEQLGFNTAVSGARSLGTLFPISPEMLAHESYNLVIHVSDPKKDPVVTYPYLFTVSLADDGEVLITPADSSLAQQGPPCEEQYGSNSSSPPSNSNSPIGGVVTTPDSETTGGSTVPPLCPVGWSCQLGTVCPPISNCTANVPEGGNPFPQDPFPETETTPDSPTQPEVIEDNPVAVEETGQTVPEVPTEAVELEHVELEEVVITGSTVADVGEMRATIDYGNSLKYKLGAELEYGYDLTFEEEPEVVGVVLKYNAEYWVPRYQSSTRVHAKLYVPDPSNAGSWMPHDSVKRKIQIDFIARSNEKGMALNKNLPSSPQTSPDLFFAAAQNSDSECSVDPSGRGHFGRCITRQPVNEESFEVMSEDYGAFGKMDVSCEGCVQLRLVAGQVYPADPSAPNWGPAVEEPNQERRAVYIPVDENRNTIADGWAPEKVLAKPATADDETDPVGNGVAGDGLSAYEEYRGFFSKWGGHHRTSLTKKTLIIENDQSLATQELSRAAGLEVIDIANNQHRGRIVNFNYGHAHVVDQHGLRLIVDDSIGDDVAGRCFCDLDRPKGARRVTVKSDSMWSSTVTHELGHAIGMRHHGDYAWPEEEEVRAMTSGIRDLFPGRVHSDVKLCGKDLPHEFRVGTKGDQGSGNHQCFMRYRHTNYVYEQEGEDYDCMPRYERTVFDDSNVGTGVNGFHRTADDADRGNCKSQIWITSQ